MNKLTLDSMIIAGDSLFVRDEANYLVVEIQVYDNEPEIIINRKSNFKDKIEYYVGAYNSDLTLKSNSNIKIIKYDFLETLDDMEEYLTSIDVGSTVQITDTGDCYTAYVSFIEKYCPEYLGYYVYNEVPNLEDEYEVVGVYANERGNENICIIKNSKKQVYLIDMTGLIVSR